MLRANIKYNTLIAWTVDLIVWTVDLFDKVIKQEL
jgi:hypothetical protein